MYFADGGVLLSFPWSAFAPEQSIGFWIVESPKQLESLEDTEKKLISMGADAPSGVPGLHVVLLNLQRSLIRRTSVADQHQFLLGPRKPRHHVIPLYTHENSINFAMVDISFSSEMLRRGIFLAALHYLAIPSAEEVDGTSWMKIISTLASLYADVPGALLREWKHGLPTNGE